MYWFLCLSSWEVNMTNMVSASSRHALTHKCAVKCSHHSSMWAFSVKMSYASNLLCISAIGSGLVAPGSQFLQIDIRHPFMRPFLQKERQIFFNVQAMGFCHLNHGVYHSTGFCATRCIAEQPVLSADGHWTDAVFAELCEYSHNPAYPNKSLIRSFSPVSLKTKRFRIQSCG